MARNASSTVPPWPRVFLPSPPAQFSTAPLLEEADVAFERPLLIYAAHLLHNLGGLAAFTAEEATPVELPEGPFSHLMAQLTELKNSQDFDLALDIFNDYLEPTSPKFIKETTPFRLAIFNEFSKGSFAKLLELPQKLAASTPSQDEAPKVEFSTRYDARQAVAREAELKLKDKAGWKKRWVRIMDDGNMFEFMKPTNRIPSAEVDLRGAAVALKKKGPQALTKRCASPSPCRQEQDNI